MAYDQRLLDRVLDLLDDTKDITQKKMFGGICVLERGNMLCAVDKDRLMVRVGPDQYERALARKHCHALDLTRRPMKGLVLVESPGLKTRKSLRSWLEMGLAFTSSLPQK